ncbi:MAG: zinc-dependent metalloprotease [Azospirillaceae bacterium]|nr:zinc-dependent metalloprotease [Azospirillaceae bacterium]
MRHRYLAALAVVLLSTTAMAASPAAPPPSFQGATALDGLLPVHVDKAKGQIFLTLPAPGADGVMARYLYTPALRTGLGSAPTFLDRGRIGETQVLAFRRLGAKVAIQFENPRFHAPEGGVNPDFATSIVWMGDAVPLTDGRVAVDIAKFLAADTLGIAKSLGQESDAMGTGGGQQGAGKGFKLDAGLSAADPASLKLFPDNLEVDAIQTYTSDHPGAEVENIAPDARQVSFTVHHSFIRLPAPGFVPRAFDPRIGGFATQSVDYSRPLGQDVVRDVANRFRLEKVDPTAARSRMKKPIVFYLDRAAPDPMRQALLDGINWWAKAFEAAGYIDAFHAELLPEGADPMDVRYNIVNWVDRATRGWSYGQEIVDPRTGEIVKGMVVLGSERVRQDILIFQGLVGADKVGTGGPNDPVRVALARLRQLGAHEVGHSLGFAHNFAASTQNRASVMDYPAPRIGLVDGRPDLSDAYGTGVGRWDMATVDWLYGQDDQAEAKAAAVVAAGLRYVEDDNARRPDTAQPWAGLWDDGAEPAAELNRLMGVRRAAIDQFGLKALAPGEAVAELRRRFVPIWLLHRYQVNAAAKAVGGVDFAYAVAGGGNEGSAPVPAAAQRAALAALLGTLSADQLRLPAGLLPLLSAARNGSDNRQYDIELFATAGGPVFDPLVAADVAASVTLSTLLAPTRLARLEAQHAADPQALGVAEVLDRLMAAVLPDKSDAVSRRVAYRTLITLAQVAHRPGTTPEVAALADQRVHEVAETLAHARGDAEERAWGASLARQLSDPQQLDKLLADRPRTVEVPPGDPIGGGNWAEGDWMDLPIQ